MTITTMLYESKCVRSFFFIMEIFMKLYSKIRFFFLSSLRSHAFFYFFFTLVKDFCASFPRTCWKLSSNWEYDAAYCCCRCFCCCLLRKTLGSSVFLIFSLFSSVLLIEHLPHSSLPFAMTCLVVLWWWWWWQCWSSATILLPLLLSSWSLYIVLRPNNVALKNKSIYISSIRFPYSSTNISMISSIRCGSCKCSW